MIPPGGGLGNFLSIIEDTRRPHTIVDALVVRLRSSATYPEKCQQGVMSR
jgi:hypothetical protein